MTRIASFLLLLCVGLAALTAGAAQAGEDQSREEQHLDYARLLLTEGRGYQNVGRFEDAAEALDGAIEILEEIFEEDNSILAGALHDRARLYASHGQPAEAERLFRRALAIREARLGPDSLYTQDTREALAALYQAQGRTEEVAEVAP
ncbi:MAG: tetratricopeptide repeat protein [Maricaulaceae bacterium]|jgi:tetratricopeptide (TPR) repeat protein